MRLFRRKPRPCTCDRATPDEMRLSVLVRDAALMDAWRHMAEMERERREEAEGILAEVLASEPCFPDD